MNTSAILAIFKKELRAYFDNPSSYIILTVFLFLWQYLFFRNAFIISEASLRGLLTYIPWLFIILIPALTMGSISGERGEGTLEFLLTHPLRLVELIIGKFLAATFFVTVGLMFMIPVAVSFDQFGNIDWGVVFGQFLASVMVTSVFVALGIFISSLFTSQIAALLLAAASSFILVIIGFELITLSLPASIAAIFERISILSHFDSMSRGVIDLRDVWYLLSTVTIFLSLAYLQLLRLRIGNRKSIYQQHLIGISLFIGIAILINIVGTRIPGRLDLTQDQIYQLTPTTRQIISGLTDIVNINLYASGELPAQLRPILRDTKDILRDYQLYSNGNIKVNIKDPGKSPQLITEANSLGIREVQFNVIGQEELQLKKGFLGLAVVYGGKTEIIPVLSNTSDLEYQLTSFIKKLTTNDKKTVAYITGHGEKTRADYQTFTTELEKLYTVQEVDFASQENPVTIPDQTNTLIIAGPRTETPTPDRERIAEFFNQGGSVLLLLDGTNVNDATLTANTNNYSLADFIESFGFSLGQNIVYDLNSNETVNFGSGDGVSFIIQYPFWPRVIAADKNHPITRRLDSLVLPWPSSITINTDTVNQLGYQATPLFKTSRFGGTQLGTFNLQPDQKITPEELSEQTVAVSLIGTEQSDGRVPRMVIVGDSDFLAEPMIRNTPENLGFGLEAVGWLSQEQSLAEIQLKQATAHPLLFQDKTQIALVKYGNLGLAFILPLVFGTTRVFKRRNLRYQTYSSTHV